MDVQFIGEEILPIFRGQVLKVGLGKLEIRALPFLSLIYHSLSLCKVKEG